VCPQTPGARIRALGFAAPNVRRRHGPSGGAGRRAAGWFCKRSPLAARPLDTPPGPSGRTAAGAPSPPTQPAHQRRREAQRPEAAPGA